MKVKIYAEKVYRPANVVTDEIVYLGDVDASSLHVAFIKALRMYNKNARRGIASPFFKWGGKTYMCTEYGEVSSRGTKWLWSLNELNVKTGRFTDKQYILNIPKSKVNSPDWMKYLE